MSRSVLFPLVAAAALVLAACGSDSSSSADSPELDGRSFVATSIEGQELVEGTDIRISFADGALTANAGCNTLGGDYTLDGNTLNVGPMFGTEMACEPALMDQDVWLTEFLTSEPSVALTGDVLALTGDGRTINMLDVETADPDRPIEGTLWIVDGLVTDDAVSSVPAEATASIIIEDGTAVVETGCNSAGGPVEVGEDTLTFGGMAMTLMACPPAETELEAAVLAVFEGEVTYEIEADRLTLHRTTPNGTIGLTLKASA